MRAVDEKQQRILKDFFDQEKTWGPEYYGLWLTAGILLFVAMILFIMPYQIWEEDHEMFGIFLFLELMGMEQYVKQYCVFREDGKVRSVYEKIRFLPVAHSQFVLYILKKLLKSCLWLTSIAVACQVVFAVIFMHTCSLGNFLMPLLCCLVLPMLMLGSTFLWRK